MARVIDFTAPTRSDCIDRGDIMRTSFSDVQRAKMSRNYGLDLARILAAYMVVAGHLIYGGALATDRPYIDWAGKNEPLPLLTHNSLWMFDSFLLGHYGTALAIIGVSLFFLISGWLMPPMLERYSRSQFLLNRVLRIFPMLIVAVLLAAAIQYFDGDKASLDKGNIIATATLTATLVGKPLTLGVVWTLIIEFEYYLLIAALGRLTQRKIILTCLGIAAITAVYAVFKVQSSALLPEFYFLIYMLIASSARVAFDEFKLSEKWLAFFAPVVVLAVFEFNRYLLIFRLMGHPGQDINAVSLLVTVSLFGLFLLGHWMIARCRMARWIVEQFSDLTYSIYLTHLALGIFLISRLRHYISSDYVTLSLTVFLVTVLSVVSYRFIELPGIRAFKVIGMRQKNLQARKIATHQA